MFFNFGTVIVNGKWLQLTLLTVISVELMQICHRANSGLLKRFDIDNITRKFCETCGIRRHKSPRYFYTSPHEIDCVTVITDLIVFKQRF